METTKNAKLFFVVLGLSLVLSGCGGGGGGGGAAAPAALPETPAPVVRQEIDVQDGQNITVQATNALVRINWTSSGGSLTRQDVQYSDSVISNANGGSGAPGAVFYTDVDLASTGSFDASTNNRVNVTVVKIDSATSLPNTTVVLEVPTANIAAAMVSSHHKQ